MSLVRTALWGPHVLLLILAAGVWFTLRGRFMQLWKLPRMAAGALRGRRADGGKISPFQALSASLAGSLGTGNIIGVAAALTAGGPGAVVWMWISAFFGMMTVYAEGVLAAKFATGEAPGAIGYVRRARGKHAAKLDAAGCVLSALGMGTMAQTGAVSAALGAVGVPPWAAGLLTAVLLVLCVRGGLQKAVRVTEKLVPFMAGLFLLACGAVLALRAAYIPAAVQTMVREAFSLRAVGGGAVGRRIYVFFAAVSCFLGCILPFTGVLSFCDAFNGVMAIPNILSLFLLSGRVFGNAAEEKRKSSSYFHTKCEKV